MNNNDNLNSENLDQIMDLVGELLINKSRLETLEAFKEESKDVLSQLDRITAELHDKVMQLRMVPISNIFNEFPNIISSSKKDIKLEVEGEDIKVDRGIVKKLNEPLTKFVKSLTKNTGKQEILKSKKISVRSHKTGNEVIIEFEDDSQKIDLEKFEEKIIKNNIYSKEERAKMSEEKKYNLILKDNISTKTLFESSEKEITEIKNINEIIEELNGKLYIELSEDHNLKTVIRIPLKFAITEALMVKVDSDLFAIPLEMVSETKKISRNQIKKVENKNVINYRKKTIPIIDSYDFLNFKKQKENSLDSEMAIVIVNAGKNYAALRVDELLNQQDIVVKSMGELLGNVKNIAGATIIGDGEIALIMDVRNIV